MPISATPDPGQVMRLLDANINRAMEGLRTLEDVCRLIHEDASCAARAKSLRHELAEVSGAIPRLERLAARNVGDDAGTAATTSGEQTRADWADVVAAAGERTLQAMRNLEEFSKLLPQSLVEMAAKFKTLRYRAYDDLAQIELSLHGQSAGAGETGRRRERLLASRLYLLISCDRSLESFAQLLPALAHAGVDCFQLRDKRAEAATLMQYAKAAMSSLVGTKALFIVNDRIDIALASGADGVHLGQEDMSLRDGRRLAGSHRLAGSRLLIGVSTHNLQQAEQAVEQGADYIGCGPTFPSQTKEFEAFAGPAFLRQVAQCIPLPAFAIGGIDSANLDQVIAAGVSRIAVSNAILGSSSPTSAASALRDQLPT